MEIIREKANQIITNEEPRIYMVEDDAGGCEIFITLCKDKEEANREEDILPYLHSYMDDVFGDILAPFFRTIAWFNYIMEHPDHKQIKKTPSGVDMNGLRITADEPTLKKIRSKQIHRVCTLWTVSGHFRHYKNGKTVYIKPYLKGKNRKAYQHEH